MPAAFKYYAFISYSRKDSKVATWLQKRLEWFRFPVKLVDEDRRPPNARYVRPIYRDKTDLEVTDQHYWTNIRSALEESRYLIVLCSPNAAGSEPVNLEVTHFLETHDGDASVVVPVIVGGNVTGTGADAALCPALRSLGDTLTNRNLPTMVPDAVTAEQDAWEMGFVSLVSYLLRLERAALGNHIQRETKRQARVLRRWLTAVGTLGLVAVATAWLAWWQRGVAEHQRGVAEHQRGVAEQRRVEAEQAHALETVARGQAETARTAAVEAARQTRLRASKADTDIALDLAARGEDAHAFALAVRAIELNEENQIAAVLAYRLLTDGRLALPEHLITHRSIATALAFSRDGKRLAIGCDDGSLSVTDLISGETFSLKKPFEGRVEKVVFNPDGTSVAIAAFGQVSTWTWGPKGDALPMVIGHFIYEAFDLGWPTADRIAAFSGRSWGSGYRLGQVFAPADAFGSPGRGWKIIFAISDSDADEFAGFDAETLRHIVHMHAFELWVAGSSDLLALQDFSKHRLLWLDLASPNINRPVFSTSIADEKAVFVAKESGAAVIGNDPRSEQAPVAESGVFEWVDPRTRKRQSMRPGKGTAIEGFSANGESMLLSTEYGAALVECSSGKIQLEHFWKNEGAAKLLTLDRDGGAWMLLPRQAARQSSPIMATALRKENLRETSLSLPASAAYLTAPYSSALGGLAEFDSTGHWLAVASGDKSVRVWSRTTLSQAALSLTFVPWKASEPVVEESDIFSTASETADETPPSTNALGYVFKAKDDDGGIIYRRDPTTGQLTKITRVTIPPEVKMTTDQGTTGHCFSPDGRRLAVSYGSWSDRPDNAEPGVAILYDTETGQAIGAPLRHGDDVFSPQFSPDGKWFVTGSDDCTVRRWDGETGAAIGEPLRLPSRIRYVQVSPRSDLIVTGRGDLIDVAKWSAVRQLSPHPKFEIARAYFSPDGLWLATVSNSFSKTGDSRELNYTALDQWEVSTGSRIAEPIETTKDTDFQWVDPGATLASSKLTWQCVFPAPIRNVLPLLQACRAMVFDEAGEKTVNPGCSLRSVRIEKLFPQGRTESNAPEYDLAARVLYRAAPPPSPSGSASSSSN